MSRYSATARYKNREERADRGRSEHGKMVPYGTSTMSDEEFWGKVRETARLQDEGLLNRSGVRQGRFPQKASDKGMAEY